MTSFARKLRATIQNTTRSLPASQMLTETYIAGNLVALDSSCGRVLRLGGLRTMRALSNYDEYLDRMARRLAAAMARPGHSIQAYFVRDPTFAQAWADELTRPQRNAADYFDLDLAENIDIRNGLIAGRVIPEYTYLVLWTRPSAIDIKEVQAVDSDIRSPEMWPIAENAQKILPFSLKLETLHNSWADDVIETLTSMEITLSPTTVQEALTAMRASIRPALTSTNFPTWLPGDAPASNAKPAIKRSDIPVSRATDKDISGDIWPSLSDAIFDGVDAQIITGDRVRLGNTIWATYEMSRGPLDQQAFSSLLRRLRQDTDFPWRASFHIETDVFARLGIKKILAMLSSITSKDHTKLLYDAIRWSETSERAGRKVVGMQAIFSTWASVAEERAKPGTIDVRASRLQRSIESWGSCQISAGGDPLTLTIGGGLGINPSSPAQRGEVPVDVALRFLPLDRSASPMSSGSITFVTETDTPFAWDIGSSLQDTAADFIVGPPGKGKSNLISSMIMAYVLSPTTLAKMSDRSLPYYGMIDIGYSQIGVINTLREALPPHRTEEAQYHRLQNTDEYSINPLDTQPGFRHPIAVERDAMVNFFTTLVTPVGAPRPPSRLSELAGAVIDQAFRSVSDLPEDQGTPKKWVRGYDREADALIQHYNIPVDEGRTVWWAIVDMLHQIGTPEATNAAILVQRNAVPRTDDLGKVLTTTGIENVWGAARTDTTERLVDMFRIALTSVATDFKILSRPTRFRLGQGRVVVLDLGSIVGGEGAAAEKKTAVMYMLARSVLTKDFYLTDDLLSKAPAIWAAWHTRRVRLYREAPKRLVYDEYHKTKSAEGVREQLIVDIREGRKWGVQVQVASQDIGDFDPRALANATSVFILGLGNDDAVRRVAEIYNLSVEAVRRLRENLNGPSRRGAPFLGIFSMKDGRHEHFLYNVKSAYELWSDSTSPNDVAVRNRVVAKIGYSTACLALARRFTAGTAKSAMERLIAEDPNMPVFETIADEIVASHLKGLN